MTGDPPFCSCITCSDEGAAMRVLEVAGDGIATCADARDRREEIDVTLVAPVAPGDSVLAHAGVAIARLEGAPL